MVARDGLHHIFLFLPASDLRSVPCVCSEWLRVVQPSNRNSTLWRAITTIHATDLFDLVLPPSGLQLDWSTETPAGPANTENQAGFRELDARLPPSWPTSLDVSRMDFRPGSPHQFVLPSSPHKGKLDSQKALSVVSMGRRGWDRCVRAATPFMARSRANVQHIPFTIALCLPSASTTTTTTSSSTTTSSTTMTTTTSSDVSLSSSSVSPLPSYSSSFTSSSAFTSPSSSTTTSTSILSTSSSASTDSSSDPRSRPAFRLPSPFTPREVASRPLWGALPDLSASLASLYASFAGSPPAAPQPTFQRQRSEPLPSLATPPLARNFSAPSVRLKRQEWAVGLTMMAYFEVSIGPQEEADPEEKNTQPRRIRRDADCVAVGLATDDFPLTDKQPGWVPDSFGLHGDDGHKFHATGRGSPFTRAFGPGDVVGCGLDYFAGEIFFTLNGVFLGVAFDDVPPEPLYPVVGIDTRCLITVNFGASQFAFDLRGHERELWAKRNSTLMGCAGLGTRQTNVSALLPPAPSKKRRKVESVAMEEHDDEDEGDLFSFEGDEGEGDALDEESDQRYVRRHIMNWLERLRRRDSE